MDGKEENPGPDRFLTIPNALSSYRLCAAPFIAGLVYLQNRDAFAVLLVISLLTDMLDGLIARFSNQASRLGARLDSLADMATFIVAAIGLWVFERDTLRPEAT